MIHAPGHYTFPLVYGNALNGDKTYNTNSYGTPTFVDHQGEQIDNPYIYLTHNGANVPYDACIVWQDAPHLITPSSLKLSSDKHSIEFDIERNNICQGNSVIAVRDKDGNIMWSWHIWVTDHALTKTYEVHNNANVGGAVTSYFMEVPLGWCDPEVRVDGELRKYHITVKQTDISGETGTVTIPHIRNYTYGGNVPYYQWGRKDPFLPGNGVGNVDKPSYDNTYTAFSSQYGTVATNIAIQHPNIFYYVLNASWSSSNSLEYWNRGNTATAANNYYVNKTIYSPSPTGYVEPKSAAFTGFTIGGSNTQNSSQYNVNGKYNKGWNFYCLPNYQGSNLLFLALGLRNIATWDSNVYSTPGYVNCSPGLYWTSGPAPTSTLALDLTFHEGMVYPTDAYYRATGCTLLPVTQ